MKKGLLKENQISELFHLPLDKIFNTSGRSGKGNEEKKSSVEKIKDKYPILKTYSQPINENLWISFFKYGIVDRDELKISIENSIYYKDENTPDWIKLWYWVDLEDEEFKKLFDSVFNNFKDLNIDNKYVLLQITGMFLMFANYGLITLSKENIIEIAENNVQNLIRIGNLKLDKIDNPFSDSSHGLGYQGRELIEFQCFSKYLNDHANISQFDDYPKLAEELLKIFIEKSVDDFIERITLSNSKNNLYFEVPILKYIPATIFVSTFLKLSNTEKKNFSWQFERRYKFPTYNNTLREELDWLKEVYTLLDIEKSKLTGKVSGNIIKELLLKSLAKIIDTLEVIK